MVLNASIKPPLATVFLNLGFRLQTSCLFACSDLRCSPQTSQRILTLALHDKLRPLPGAYRLEGGALMHAEHAHNEDLGGIESMIDMDAGFVDDEDSGDEV